MRWKKISITNIIKYTDKLNLKYTGDKIDAYVDYLSKHTGISKYRMRKILTFEPTALLTITDLVSFAEVFKVDITELFKEDDS